MILKKERKTNGPLSEGYVCASILRICENKYKTRSFFLLQETRKE
jgi:hypothetical protein